MVLSRSDASGWWHKMIPKEELEGDWIDVDEKRPEEGLNVLCAHTYWDVVVVEIGHYVGYDDYSDGRVYLFKNDDDRYICCEKWKYIV